MTRSDVKVGDKVRIVNAWLSGGQYKNGDVLTVESVSGDFIYVNAKGMKRLLLSTEYELYKPIRVGDTVTLIDKPWETDVWKGMDRFYKKYFMKLKGAIWTVEKIRIGYFNADYDCDDSQNGCPFIVPIDLLRKVELKLDGKNANFACIDELPDPIHRHTPDQIAEAQRIIGEIVAGFKYGQCFYIRDESQKHLTIRYTAETADGMHTFTANCSPHDEFNRTIGIMVALCKAVGRKLPDWL